MKNKLLNHIQNKYIQIYLWLISLSFSYVNAQVNNYIHEFTPTLPTVSSSFSIENKDMKQIIRFYDGMGKLRQRVIPNITSSEESISKDLVSLYEYDALFRLNKEWFPVPMDRNSLGIERYDHNILKQTSKSFYSDNNALKETFYSILDNVVFIQEAGDNFRSGSTPRKYKKTNYLVNDSTDLVYNYKLTSSGFVVASNEYYKKQELYKEVYYDEDYYTPRYNRAKVVFKDRQGKVILERTGHDEERWAESTYYIYDKLGNLSAVVPDLCKHLSINDKLEEFPAVYLYDYDLKGRCIKKRVADTDWLYMVYDKGDNLIYSQDGVQREKKEWSFYVYDSFNRPVLSGSCKMNISHEQLINSIELYSDMRATYEGSGILGYSLPQFYNIRQEDVLIANYYDNYRFMNDIPEFSSKNTLLGFDGSKGYGELRTYPCKQLQTGRYIRIFNEPQYEIETNYFDNKERLIQSRRIDHEQNLNVNMNSYTFTGILQKSLNLIQGNTNQQEEYSYVLDKNERLTKVLRNGIELVDNAYNYLGQITKSRIHTKEDIQYKYHLRGYVTDIKSNDFEQKLYYEKDPEGKDKLFNGFISGIYTKSPTIHLMTDIGYSSDQIYTGCSSKNLSGVQPNNNSYDEIISQNYCGRISWIYRTENGKTSAFYDSFEYEPNSFKLSSFYNEVTTSDPDYMNLQYNGTNSYDKNGNMLSYGARGISSIRYNSLNLPDTIQFKNGNQIVNRYLADGTKLSAKYLTYPINIVLPNDTIVKIEEDPRTTIIDHFCGSYHYTTQNGLKQLNRILTPYGYIKPADAIAQSGRTKASLQEDITSLDINDLSSGSENNNISQEIEAPTLTISPLYCYYIKDYQGNIRQVVQFDENGNREVIQSTDYFPSGTVMHTSSGQSEQPDKYNGKELIRMHGLDWYDYGARYYDAVISQFTTIDPLAEKYYSTSPYAYCAGNPVMFVDPDGRDVWHVDGSGNVVKRIEDKTQDAFYMVAKDADGNYQKSTWTDKDGNEHYNFVTFEYGTVESHKNISIGKNESMDIFKVRGDDNGIRLFEFMATNVAPSLVEFSHIKTGVEGNKGLNFVTTSHDERKDRSMGMLWANQLNYGYTLREINHSHPTNDEASPRDIDASIYINSIYNRSRKPTYNIFFVPELRYIPFN